MNLVLRLMSAAAKKSHALKFSALYLKLFKQKYSPKVLALISGIKESIQDGSTEKKYDRKMDSATEKRGFKCKVPLVEVVESIAYGVKTGYQWRELPSKEFLTTEAIFWNSIFYYFNKWSKSGCWEQVWVNFLREHRCFLDLFSMALDGSHTPAKNGGEAVASQGRKACKISNVR